MPVVSASIMKLMVPVGAKTVACELRTPNSSPSRTAASQASWAARATYGGRRSRPSMRRLASRCMRSTRSMCSSLAAKPANGPMRAAVRALVA